MCIGQCVTGVSPSEACGLSAKSVSCDESLRATLCTCGVPGLAYNSSTRMCTGKKDNYCHNTCVVMKGCGPCIMVVWQVMWSPEGEKNLSHGKEGSMQGPGWSFNNSSLPHDLQKLVKFHHRGHRPCPPVMPIISIVIPVPHLFFGAVFACASEKGLQIFAVNHFPEVKVQ